jgi:hypothetical protein
MLIQVNRIRRNGILPERIRPCVLPNSSDITQCYKDFAVLAAGFLHAGAPSAENIQRHAVSSELQKNADVEFRFDVCVRNNNQQNSDRTDPVQIRSGLRSDPDNETSDLQSSSEQGRPRPDRQHCQAEAESFHHLREHRSRRSGRHNRSYDRAVPE